MACLEDIGIPEPAFGELRVADQGCSSCQSLDNNQARRIVRDYRVTCFKALHEPASNSNCLRSFFVRN